MACMKTLLLPVLMAEYEVYGIILPGYQILGLLSSTNYVSLSNDWDFATQRWSQWQLLVDWILKQINTNIGLLSLNGGYI